MNRNEIISQLNQILIDEFEVDEEVIVETADLKKSLDLDSLDYVDLVVLIEANFGVKLVEADFKAMVTFQDFYTIVENKIATK
jgi:acyl carrier protein